MTTLVEIGLSNLCIAAVLAMLAAAVGRWGRRPALTHGLWVLVFLKLITPPLVIVPIGWLEPAAHFASAESDIVEVATLPVDRNLPAGIAWELEIDEPPAEGNEIILPPTRSAPDVAASPRASNAGSTSPAVHWMSTFPWVAAAGWLWCLTGAASLFLAGYRIWQFQRMLRRAAVAPSEIQAEVGRLARVLGLKDKPVVWLVLQAMSPALWVLGKRRAILIPEGLLERLSPEQRATLLAHELAHLRRRDHWVRCLELAVLSLYWWCPLVWWARARLREAEEECCDAWVVWALPGAARAYAFALVETVDFLAGAPPALPQLASGFGPVQRLQRRLTMILRGTAPRTLTAAGGVLLIALGMGLLPLMPSWGQEVRRDREAGGERKKEAERKKDAERSKEKEAQEEDQAFNLKKLRLMQADLERARAQLEAQRAELDKRAMELQRAMELLKRHERYPGFGEKPDPKPRPEKAPGGRAGGPGKGPAGMGPPPDLERRLREMERKLESLLDEMAALRRDLKKGPGFGGSPGRFAPKERPDAPESPKAPKRDPDRRSGQGPMGPGAPPGPAGPGPGFVPRPVDPPAPPAGNLPRPRDPNLDDGPRG